MKITIGEVINSVESVKALQEVKFPVKVSYKLKRLVDKLSPIIKTYNTEKDELVKKFGTKNEDNSFSVKDEKLQDFYPEIKKLLEVEEEVDFEKIPVAELGDVQIEPKLLLDFIFE